MRHSFEYPPAFGTEVPRVLNIPLLAPSCLFVAIEPVLDYEKGVKIGDMFCFWFQTGDRMYLVTLYN